MPTMGMPVQDLSRDDIARYMEAAAQERLGMSAYEMVTAYKAGELREPGIVSDVLALSLLLVEDDPLFAGVRSSVSPR